MWDFTMTVQVRISDKSQGKWFLSKHLFTENTALEADLVEECVPECVPEDPYHHCTAASPSSRADVVAPLLGQRGAGSGTRAAERVTSLRIKVKQYLCQPRQVYGKRGYHRTSWHLNCRLGLYTR